MEDGQAVELGVATSVAREGWREVAGRAAALAEADESLQRAQEVVALAEG